MLAKFIMILEFVVFTKNWNYCYWDMTRFIFLFMLNSLHLLSISQIYSIYSAFLRCFTFFCQKMHPLFEVIDMLQLHNTIDVKVKKHKSKNVKHQEDEALRNCYSCGISSRRASFAPSCRVLSYLSVYNKLDSSAAALFNRSSWSSSSNT
jgi:hypothetical protein